MKSTLLRFVLFVAPMAFAIGAEPASAAKPNIILIMADDIGTRDLSCYGSRRSSTPNLGRPASEGMRFTEHGQTCR